MPLIEGKFIDFSNTFLEILDNCNKAMADSDLKTLYVRLQKVNEFIEIRFQDSGIGVADDVREELLKKLNAENEITKTMDRHVSGIERIAMLMRPYGANFDIESQPGRTTFIMRLPI